jgi:hypothetical protein
MPNDTRSDLPALLQTLSATEQSVAEFFGSLSPSEFALRENTAWTPAEHLAHLNTAVSAVARGFQISRWILRLRFGRSHRPSRSYETLRNDYRARLAGGGVATGVFVPPHEDLTPEQSSLRQTEILARWGRVNQRLRSALERWTEKDLDRLQLPHPLLGRITAREMIYFTIYHDQHHVAGAKRRLPRFSGDAHDAH